MSMYYAALLTYSDRQTKLFSKARTHPSILTNLYNKLNCQYLLIPHPIGDGKRRPPLPALTIDGFEHWMLIQVLLNPDEEYKRITAFLQSPKRVVIDSATQRPIPTTSIPRSAFPATPNDWVVKRYSGLLEKALSSTVGRAEEIEEIPDIEGARKELEYFKQKSTDVQSETHKTQAELVSTRKELDWIKAKLTGVQSEEETARKRLAEKEGEVEWMKKELAEAQAELESSRNEVEGLRRLNVARSGSVSSVSSMGTAYTLVGAGGGAQGGRLPYPVSATPGATAGTPAPTQGMAYYRQQYRPST
ncbi:hypothetical protein L873DRAFT_1831142 [Choiromyces venosus 120613-1]|uniref:DUF7514 domain-containing protein n=1 Tax=Choiromyces venosus 120613-1 TaxID=1336337 RepID=A0A3N4J7D8_9PEZI|nr:hypothetical protein L873DRAFT_1831142 [Choiromyces venosus 120613-1]